MRPIMNIKMCAFVAAALAVPAFAPAPAFAASADYYLKFGDVKPVPSKVEGGEAAARSAPGKHIEILSWSWGATSMAKYGAVAGAHRDDGLSDVSTKAERAVAQPLDRGSLRVKVKVPWLDCKVGAALPDAMLQNDAGRYEFQDAIITGCAPDSVSFNYAKVVVRGWDPSKKEH